MVKNVKVVSLKIEEGHALLLCSSSFVCPQKLGDKTFSAGDRSAANAHVAKLYTTLKALSPIVIRDRKKAFGPEKVNGTICWRQKPNDPTNYELVSPETEVKVEFGQADIEGAIWCLLVYLHPDSPNVRPVADQAEVLWTIAKKIGRESIVREDIGLPVGEEPKLRWANRKTDDDYAREEMEDATGEKPPATSVK